MKKMLLFLVILSLLFIQSCHKNPTGSEDYPTLVVSAETMLFAFGTEPKELILSKHGDGTLSWTASLSPEVEWLSMSSTSGTLDDDNPVQIVTLTQTLESESGSLITLLTFTPNAGDPVGVAIVVNSTHWDRLAAYPSLLTFQPDDTEKTFDLSNQSEDSLSYSIAWPQSDSWLSVSPMSGLLLPSNDGNYQSQSIQLGVDRSGLAVGEYVSQLSITSQLRDTIYVSVAMEIGDSNENDLVASVESIFFEYYADIQNFDLTNNGDIATSWDIAVSPGVPWLSIPSSTGMLNSGQSEPVRVDVNRQDLDPGYYTTSLVVSSNNSEDIIIGVTMQVAEPRSFTLIDVNGNNLLTICDLADLSGIEFEVYSSTSDPDLLEFLELVTDFSWGHTHEMRTAATLLLTSPCSETCYYAI